MVDFAKKLKEKPGEQVLGNQVLDTTGAPPATTNGGALVTATTDDDLAAYAGAGNEHVRIEDVKTPFLMVLQSGSPECKKSHSKYVPGAEEGMLMHGLTKHLYDGRYGVEAIDVFFDPLVNRWVPRNEGSGGGFRGSFPPGDPRLKQLMEQAKPNPKNELVFDLPDKTQLVNANNHYLLVRPYVLPEHAAAGELPAHDWTPVVLSLSSTQIKKSRELNALIGLEKVRNAAGQLVPIPRFGIVWRITTVPESNAQGSWFGVKFERLRRVEKEELYASVGFHKMLAAGERRADMSELDRGDDAGVVAGTAREVKVGADGKPLV